MDQLRGGDARRAIGHLWATLAVAYPDVEYSVETSDADIPHVIFSASSDDPFRPLCFSLEPRGDAWVFVDANNPAEPLAVGFTPSSAAAGAARRAEDELCALGMMPDRLLGPLGTDWAASLTCAGGVQ